MKEIKTNLAQTQILTAVSFDLETLELTINTDDFSFAFATAEVVIEIEQRVFVGAEDFIFSIKFDADLPVFDKTGFEVKPLTCSTKDASWIMILPPATTEEFSPVTIELHPSSDNFFSFALANGAITLKSLFNKCPETDKIELKFELTSALLGTNEQSISVPLKASGTDDDDDNAFAGVIITENTEELEPSQPASR